MKELMDMYEAKKVSSPKLALWLYKAPRKVMRLTRNLVMKNLPEKGAEEIAIYSQTKAIDIVKNKEVLHFEPRYSLEDGMRLTNEWMKQTDLYK